jgi:hypothetical protein
MSYSNLEKKLIFSTYTPPVLIRLPHRFIVHRNPQYTILFDSCLSYLRTWSGIICEFITPLTEFLDLLVNRSTRQTLPIVNKKHFFMKILRIGSFCPQKRTTGLCSSVVHSSSSRHFDYWNHRLNMHMRVCYLDCHEAGLCCYLVIHI